MALATLQRVEGQHAGRASRAAGRAAGRPRRPQGRLPGRAVSQSSSPARRGAADVGRARDRCNPRHRAHSRVRRVCKPPAGSLTALSQRDSTWKTCDHDPTDPYRGTGGIAHLFSNRGRLRFRATNSVLAHSVGRLGAYIRVPRLLKPAAVPGSEAKERSGKRGLIISLMIEPPFDPLSSEYLLGIPVGRRIRIQTSRGGGFGGRTCTRASALRVLLPHPRGPSGRGHAAVPGRSPWSSARPVRHSGVTRQSRRSVTRRQVRTLPGAENAAG